MSASVSWLTLAINSIQQRRVDFEVSVIISLTSGRATRGSGWIPTRGDV
jgi:hypothetical protein